MAKSFDTQPPTEIADDQPVAAQHAGGTPDGIAPGYALEPGGGPAIWIGGSLMTMKARARDTDGGYSLMETFGPRDLAAPGHVHENESEAFYILDGTIDLGVGDTVYHAQPGSFVHVPKQTVHDWRITSATCRFLVFVLPAGFEHFFEELADPAQSLTFPYTEHRAPTPDEFLSVGSRYAWRPERGPQGTGAVFPPMAGRLVTSAEASDIPGDDARRRRKG
ncbi:quercetin 2,3-dioxygenase [Streptomyces sp. NPDC007162]|uniref:quercetin 2,3-dioxygenase n=1 Tax=Streptomyces sp. NPDC007162 TaxID=3156917 RepID=UPI003401055B